MRSARPPQTRRGPVDVYKRQVFILLVLFTRPGEHELVELGNIATEADGEPESYKSTKKPENAA